MDGGALMEMKFPEKGFAGKIALNDGQKDVSWLWLVDMDISFGGHPVKTGGIAGVGTPNEHRGKGYSRQVLSASTSFMKKNKVPLGLLYGIRHYYTKYGYASVYPFYKATVPVFFAKHVPEPKGCTFRRIEEKDMPLLVKLYNKVCWPKTGMRARSVKTYKSFRKGTHWMAVPDPVGVFKKGELAAYAVLDVKADGIEISEVAARSYDDQMALLHYLTAEAIQRNASEIVIHTAPDDPFIAACRPFGGEVRIPYDANGGPMARIIHLESFLTQIAPLLKERAGHGWSALFDTGDQRALIKMSRSGAEVARAKKSTKAAVTVKATPGGLAQLFYGYRGLEEMCLAGDVKVSGKAVLAARFFRPEFAHMMPTDHF
jgi:predicted acetyltransferase